MKTVGMLVTVLFFGIIAFIVGWIVWYNIASREGRKKNFREQIGTYVLDVHKTALGDYYKDSDMYKKLRITFRADSTFSMNMKVPFICDSIGRWNAGNMKEWNYLWYEKWGYKDYEIGRGNQFTRPDTSDSTFLLNSATPQNGAAFIQELYFRKISR
jgi:hypothetical protein